ncbi:hypothetical protein N184_29060 [Sinorhizobium sp. GL28]|nr:hypothetical protein N184_29060 [Sinorhizobium sp. GL28]
MLDGVTARGKNGVAQTDKNEKGAPLRQMLSGKNESFPGRRRKTGNVVAKEAMTANDVEKCKSHLENAIKGMDAM